MIKVSIIIPVYNTADKLRRCLDSILEQDYKNFECLMVDDGSSDDSGNILDKYAQRDNRFIAIHKENGGVSSARNKGLEIAKGEWLVFVDSDDYLLPNHISSMMEVAGDNIDMVMTGFRFQHPDKITEHVYSKGIYCNKKELSNFIIQSDFLNWQIPWDRMYRNKDNIRFDEKLSLSEDRLYCYHYLMECKGIATINDVTYIHDVTNETSLSYKKYPSSMNEYRYAIYKKVNSDIKKKFCLSSNYSKKIFNDYMEGIYASLINAYLDEGKQFMYYLTRILYKLNLK